MGDLQTSLWSAAWVVVAWCVWVPLSRLLERNAKDPGSVIAGLAFVVNVVYVRVWHGLRIEGWENIPGARERSEERTPKGDHGPLLVIANHTAGVDPMLVQYACPFFIRWMMAAEMRVPELGPLWEWLEIIFVRTEGVRNGGQELAALKDTIRYLKAGGVIGIFPEGRLERPQGVLHPFQQGVGMIIARTEAKVLPVVITGTPWAQTAWGTLWRMSRARVRFMPVMDCKGKKGPEIVAELQRRYEEWTGWGVVETGG